MIKTCFVFQTKLFKNIENPQFFVKNSSEALKLNEGHFYELHKLLETSFQVLIESNESVVGTSSVTDLTIYEVGKEITIEILSENEPIGFITILLGHLNKDFIFTTNEIKNQLKKLSNNFKQTLPADESTKTIKKELSKAKIQYSELLKTNEVLMIKHESAQQHLKEEKEQKDSLLLENLKLQKEILEIREKL